MYTQGLFFRILLKREQKSGNLITWGKPVPGQISPKRGAIAPPGTPLYTSKDSSYSSTVEHCLSELHLDEHVG